MKRAHYLLRASRAVCLSRRTEKHVAWHQRESQIFEVTGVGATQALAIVDAAKRVEARFPRAAGWTVGIQKNRHQIP